MMEQVLEILKKYDVTPYELTTWLVSNLETLGEEIEDGIEDGDPERINSLFLELNKLNWRLTPKETIDNICSSLGSGVRGRLKELGFID